MGIEAVVITGQLWGGGPGSGSGELTSTHGWCGQWGEGSNQTQLPVIPGMGWGVIQVGRGVGGRG
jgi:hypothetical protein